MVTRNTTDLLAAYLEAGLPKHRASNGLWSAPMVAHDLELTNECVYKWIRQNFLPANKINPLIALSEEKGNGKLKRDGLLKFVDLG